MDTVRANGAEIPVLGFGTWTLRGGDATRAVGVALDVGYRHIDTAAMYGNEEAVGEGIRESGVPREAIFLTTKVWPTDVGDGPLQRAAEELVRRLAVGPVDLLLIHWPNQSVPLREQIAGLCKAKRMGLARHIGVSNFPPAFIEETLRVADEPIVTNQVEHHPYLDQSELFALCGAHGISITSYCPLGRTRLLSEPVITEIARARGKSAAQIVLRWHVQQPNNIAIPKSSHPERIAENFAVFDFALTADEMLRISALGKPNQRFVSPSGVAPDWNAAAAR